MSKKDLIIIPGLGDKTNFYSLIRPLWSLLGFKLHIFVFGWGDKTQTYDAAFSRLAKLVNGFHDGVYIIGVSAGGTAAVNMLAERKSAVNGVVTISSPYTDKLATKNTLLLASARSLKENLIKFEDSTLNKITSFYGLVDRIVPAKLSCHNRVKSKQTLTVGHMFTIAAALTIYSVSIKKVLASL